MDIVPFVQLALEVRNADHDEQVLPHVRSAQLETIANGAGSSELSSGDLAILGQQNTLAFERVEVLCERAAEVAQVVSLDNKGEQCIDLVVGV